MCITDRTGVCSKWNHHRVKRKMQDDDQFVRETSAPSDNESSTETEDSDIYVPNNPQDWKSEHISSWVQWISKKFNIYPDLVPARFPSGGIELANFTKADFWVCAGSKAGGDALAKHFAYHLQLGTGIEDKLLSNDTDPGNHHCFSPTRVLPHSKISPGKILINDQQ